MGLKLYSPTSAGRRFMSALTNEELTAIPVVKSLLKKWRRKGGRNNTGRVTMRYRGGGAKRRYRDIEFRRAKIGIPGVVAGISYDPNRTANIALIHYVDGEKTYILQPIGLKTGDAVMASPEADIRPGNALPLGKIPVGTAIHNIELKIGGRAQLCRTAGAQAQLMAKETDYGLVKLPSGEVRKIHLDCWATIGQVGNEDHRNVTIGKAGRVRWKGRKPRVRGMAMNPVDHPHGGGEGRSKGGNHPVSPTGIPTKGYKTRRRKSTNQMIVTRRTRRQ